MAASSCVSAGFETDGGFGDSDGGAVGGFGTSTATTGAAAGELCTMSPCCVDGCNTASDAKGGTPAAQKSSKHFVGPWLEHLILQSAPSQDKNLVCLVNLPGQLREYPTGKGMSHTWRPAERLAQ